jgi:1-acyl-sn-glycerol-3-phosphate acyltransferase
MSAAGAAGRLAGPRQPGVEDTRRYRVMQAADRLLVRALFRVRVEGLDHWPPAPFCLVLNHHNAWDPLIVMAVVPATPRITWFGPRVSIEEFSRGLQYRVIGFFGGAIPIDPEKATLGSAVRAVRRVFASGGVLGIFAEGHGAFAESALDPFEEGAVSFAATAQVPIVPCVVVGTTYLWLGKRLRVSFGAPIPSKGVRGAEAREELTQRVRGAMQAMLPAHEPRPPGRRLLRRFLTDLFHGPEDVARRVKALGE